MITYQVEPWPNVLPEMQKLWPDHWEEVALNKDEIKLKPDLDGYAKIHAEGMLHVLVVREKGALIGYHVSIIKRHLHYADTLHAFVDMYFIAKHKRKGMVGVALFTRAEAALRARGVKKIIQATKLHLNMSRIFERLGYVHVEHVFTKYIG